MISAYASKCWDQARLHSSVITTFAERFVLHIFANLSTCPSIFTHGVYPPLPWLSHNFLESWPKDPCNVIRGNQRRGRISLRVPRPIRSSPVGDDLRFFPGERSESFFPSFLVGGSLIFFSPYFNSKLIKIIKKNSDLEWLCRQRGDVDLTI